MTDTEATIFTLLGLAVVAYAIYLRFTVWGLRRKIERIALTTAAPKAEIPAAPRDPQIDELKTRIQVLERITTDRHHSLDREIESLRHA